MPNSWKSRWLLVTPLLGFLCVGLVTAPSLTTRAGPSGAYLSYLPDGSVALPKNYRDWAFLSSGIDMTYSRGGMTMDHHMFDNVFVDPDALRAFKATGTWPDGTVFAREDRDGVTKGSINRAGQFQSEAVEGLELHVKDAKRFKGGWAFFAFGDSKPARKIAMGAACYSCHEAHGAVDTTFVQFYPTLTPIARARKTLRLGRLRLVDRGVDWNDFVKICNRKNAGDVHARRNG